MTKFRRLSNLLLLCLLVSVASAQETNPTASDAVLFELSGNIELAEQIKNLADLIRELPEGSLSAEVISAYFGTKTQSIVLALADVLHKTPRNNATPAATVVSKRDADSGCLIGAVPILFLRKCVPAMRPAWLFLRTTVKPIAVVKGVLSRFAVKNILL